MPKKFIGFLLILLSFSSIFFIKDVVIAQADLEDIYYPGAGTDPWGFTKIKAFEASKYESGSKEVKVGILDSGINITDNGLASKVDKELSKSFLDANETNEGKGPYFEDFEFYNDPFFDPTGHGTQVAGIIVGAESENYSFPGVAPNITLVSLKITDIYGYYDPDDVAQAIIYAESIGIDILNFSAGGNNYKEIYDAIQQFTGLFVCSAGNDSLNTDTTPHYPSCYDLANIIVVGSSDEYDKIAEHSNYGKTTVDLFAPGVDIISAYPKNICSGEFRNKWLNDTHDATHITSGFHLSTGTSFATPFVTAVASLMLSQDKTNTTAIIKNTIINSVDKVEALKEYCVSGGRLNALNILKIEPHTHSFIKRYYNNRTHIAMCSCGQVSGSYETHYAIKPIGNTNPIYITCIGCKTRLDLRTDFVTYITL